jgi:hypothetical protein
VGQRVCPQRIRQAKRNDDNRYDGWEGGGDESHLAHSNGVAHAGTLPPNRQRGSPFKASLEIPADEPGSHCNFIRDGFEVETAEGGLSALDMV